MSYLASKIAIYLPRIAPIVLVLLAILPYVTSVSSYFLSDDYGLIWLLHDKPISHFLSLFAADWTEGIYGEEYDELRPFIALSYRIDGLFGAANPVPYHMSNILLHTTNTLLVYTITIVSTRRKVVAFAAGLLFAVLASHSEAVSWISGRADLIPTFAFLLTLVTFALYRANGNRAWYLLSVGIFLASLFTKQSAIVVPLLLVGYDYLVAGHYNSVSKTRSLRQIRTYSPYFAAVFMYVALRWFLFSHALREDQVTTSQLSLFLTRQVYYGIVLIFPIDPLQHTASQYFSSEQILRTASTILLVVAMVGLGFASMRRDGVGWHHLRMLLFFGPFWYVVTVVPLFVTYFSLRHTYFTSVGTSIAIAFILFSPRTWSVQKGVAISLFVLLLASHLSVLERSSLVWRAAGDIALASVQQLSELAANLEGSGRVVLAFEPEHRGAKLWAFSLPFALEYPFTNASLYKKLEIVEHPDVYCCQRIWASHRLDRIEAWAHDPQDGVVVVSWNHGTNRLEMVKKDLPANMEKWINPLRRLDGGDTAKRAQSLDLFNALSE